MKGRAVERLSDSPGGWDSKGWGDQEVEALSRRTGRQWALTSSWEAWFG